MSDLQPLEAEDQSDLPFPVVPSRIPSTHPLHRPRALTAVERDRFRRMAQRSRSRAVQAAAGELDVLHAVNEPVLNPAALMPEVEQHGLRALSLYSGGGGLDIGFERAGYSHVASYDILTHAAETLHRNRPDWTVHGGENGNVTKIDWRRWRGKAEVLHGGPPCQPFSSAGRQQGHLDPRDCWPATVKAIRAIQPLAFVAENVPALASAKFSEYVREVITAPLERSRPRYYVRRILLQAQDFGVPQVRRRVVFVGFQSKDAFDAFEPPTPTHARGETLTPGLPVTLGVRAALGLPDDDEHVDGPAPTIRSGLTGPRFTTSICNSTSASRRWEELGIWPNGVAVSREAASAFPADSGAFRLSVSDVALIQGFPASWTWPSTVYQAIGQIGNAVPPPLGYAVATALTRALRA